MKETDQLSLGSVISLRSVSDGAALETGRTTDRRKSKKAAASPYGGPLKSSPKKTSKKTGREVWMSAVKNGAGISAESSGMNTWIYGKPSNLKNRPNASKFLMEQLNMPVTGKSNRPASARAGGSGPVYKDPESYYDEIQVLKRMMKQSKTELDLLKAKNNRLEDELVAKSRKIDELLNPDTQNNDLRRTLGSKKLDASEVVMSLRRKIHKLEENLRSKENDLRKINSELKVTNFEELKFENEMYLYEIQRLNQILQENQSGTMNIVSENEINDALKDGKGRKAQILIKRLTEDNHSLVLENKSLKNDLMKLTQPVMSDTINLEKDYEDMNRSELLQKILTLEQKLKEEESQTVKSEKTENKGEEVDAEQIDERCIELRGPLPQQLKQLRARERELLGDVERLENTVKKLKEDRSHYRKMNDDYRQQLDQSSSNKNNADNISDTASVKSESVKTRRKSSGLTPRRSAEKRTSTSLKKKESTEEREEKVKALQESRAAKTIQRGWRNRPDKNNEIYKDEEDELEDAIISIQSAWRGHKKRTAYLQQTVSEQDTRLDDDDVLLIQAAFRGHTSRKNVLGKTKSRYKSPTYSRDIEADQRPFYHPEFVSDDDDDDDDDDVVIGSSASLSKYRDEKKPTRRPRNPKYFTDPDAKPYVGRDRHYSGGRSNGISDFLNDDDQRHKDYEELSQRFRNDESAKVTINKLKSSSSPWEKPKVVDESDEDVLSMSKSSKKFRKQSADNENVDLQNKWAKSGSQKKAKQSEERFERKRSLRKSHELLRDFEKDEETHSGSQSVKKRMDLIVSRKYDLDDELF